MHPPSKHRKRVQACTAPSEAQVSVEGSENRHTVVENSISSQQAEDIHACAILGKRIRNTRKPCPYVCAAGAAAVFHTPWLHPVQAKATGRCWRAPLQACMHASTACGLLQALDPAHPRCARSASRCLWTKLNSNTPDDDKPATLPTAEVKVAGRSVNQGRTTCVHQKGGRRAAEGMRKLLARAAHEVFIVHG